MPGKPFNGTIGKFGRRSALWLYGLICLYYCLVLNIMDRRQCPVLDHCISDQDFGSYLVSMAAAVPIIWHYHMLTWYYKFVTFAGKTEMSKRTRTSFSVTFRNSVGEWCRILCWTLPEGKICTITG